MLVLKIEAVQAHRNALAERNYFAVLAIAATLVWLR